MFSLIRSHVLCSRKSRELKKEQKDCGASKRGKAGGRVVRVNCSPGEGDACMVLSSNEVLSRARTSSGLVALMCSLFSKGIQSQKLGISPTHKEVG